MNQKPKRLTVIDGESLMDTRLPKRSFCIETLLPEGISMLGGAPKIGKSWMVLDIGVRVAKGESIWSLPTKRGTVLYLALEDSGTALQAHRRCSRQSVLRNRGRHTRRRSLLSDRTVYFRAS